MSNNAILFILDVAYRYEVCVRLVIVKIYPYRKISNTHWRLMATIARPSVVVYVRAPYVIVFQFLESFAV